MTDDEALALNAFQEANLESNDGMAAIVRVVLNRMTMGYSSDGTVQGTVFRHEQFSWTEFAMVDGKYTRVAFTPAEVQARAETLLTDAQKYSAAWTRAEDIVDRVSSGSYTGALYDQLTDDAVLYLNPAISSQPWATPDKLVVQIGHHQFFRA